MPSLEETIHTIAHTCGHPITDVRTRARWLREDGLLPTGPRGRAPVQMNTTHIARLLLSILAPGPSKHASRAVRELMSLMSSDPLDFRVTSMPDREGPQRITFADRAIKLEVAIKRILDVHRHPVARQLLLRRAHSIRVTYGGSSFRGHVWIKPTKLEVNRLINEMRFFGQVPLPTKLLGTDERVGVCFENESSWVADQDFTEAPIIKTVVCVDEALRRLARSLGASSSRNLPWLRIEPWPESVAGS